MPKNEATQINILQEKVLQLEKILYGLISPAVFEIHEYVEFKDGLNTLVGSVVSVELSFTENNHSDSPSGYVYEVLYKIDDLDIYRKFDQRNLRKYTNFSDRNVKEDIPLPDKK